MSHPSRHARRRTLASVAALVVLGLTACNADDDRSATPASNTAAPTSDATATSTPDTTAAPTTAAPTTAPEVVDMNDTAACLTGRWQVGVEQIRRAFENTALTSLPGMTLDVEGDGFVELRADGTFTYTPNFAVSLTFNEMSGSGTMAGTLDGTWAVEGDQLQMAQTVNNLTGSLDVMGTEVPFSTTHDFDGTATVTDCQPMTFSTRLDSPIGPIDHTYVLAP